MPRSLGKPSKETLAFRARCGQCLRAWREEELELSQADLAKELVVAIKTVARWEAGGPGPRVEDLKRMERLKPGLVLRIFSTDREELVYRRREVT